ncbi:hypothetical protein J3R82DRAFT_9322 [Butyriboletus roseoflavus]|nr:hypothetical protein J3R82DRAFT_9322 [Butyriboletus roseoflavus]
MFAKLSVLLFCVAFVCALPLNSPNVARDIALNVVDSRAPNGEHQKNTSDHPAKKRQVTGYTSAWDETGYTLVPVTQNYGYYAAA